MNGELERVRYRRELGDSSYGLCLVGGTGRSGTTLLRQIFARHPAVASLRSEARFLVDPDGIVDFHTSLETYWSPYIFDVKVRRLERLLRDLGQRGPLGGFVAPRRQVLPQPAHSGTTSAAAVEGHAVRARLRSPTALLANSPLVRLLPRYWAVNLKAECNSYERLVDELLERLIAFRFGGRWMGTPRSQESTVLYGEADVAAALRWFCRELVACVCRRQGASRLIEDTPFNLLAFDALRALLPESRLVHIYRDPRDVVASYLTRRWSPSHSELAARFYVGVMARWEVIRDTLPADSYLEMGLTDLVQQPEAVLRRICTFWSIPWDDNLLGADLSRSNRGRWQRDIPAGDIARVNEILAPYVERYGD